MQSLSSITRNCFRLIDFVRVPGLREVLLLLIQCVRDQCFPIYSCKLCLQPFGIYTYDWVPKDPLAYSHVKSIKQFFDINQSKYSMDDLSEYRKALDACVLNCQVTQLCLSYFNADTLRVTGQVQSINLEACYKNNLSMMDPARPSSNSCALLLVLF